MGILILLIAILVPGVVGSAWIGDVRAQTRVRQEDGTSLSTGGWLAVIALFLINLSISAVFAVLEPEAESLGVSKSTLGLVLGLGPLAGMALVIIQEKIFSRNSLYYTAIFHKIAAAVVVVIMLSVHNHVVFSICIVLSTALYYAAMPPNLTLGTLFGPGEQAGAYMSGSIVLGAALGPAIGGFVSGLGLLGALAALLFLGAALATGIAQFKLTRQDHREVM
jgi:predicted MFS family arabinose efflux permease